MAVEDRWGQTADEKDDAAPMSLTSAEQNYTPGSDDKHAEREDGDCRADSSSKIPKHKNNQLNNTKNCWSKVALCITITKGQYTIT